MTVDEFVVYLRAHESTAELAVTLWIVLRRGAINAGRSHPARSEGP
jgi:hypothetical protein